MWNILIIFTIVGFLVASCFGILGLLFKDLVGVADLVLGYNNLHSDDPVLIDEKDSMDLIDECMNGEGKMNKVLPYINETDVVNKVYSKEQTIETAINYLRESEKSFDNSTDCSKVYQHTKLIYDFIIHLKGEYGVYLDNEDIFSFFNCRKNKYYLIFFNRFYEATNRCYEENNIQRFRKKWNSY